jgi:hypothetical protein
MGANVDATGLIPSTPSVPPELLFQRRPARFNLLAASTMKKQILVVSAIGLFLSACQHLPQPPPAHPMPQPCVSQWNTPAPGTWPIRIVAGNYRGLLFLDGDKKCGIYDTSKPFQLKPGTHKLNVAYVGGSEFAFTVTPDGKVKDVNNKAAAHADGSSLVLHSMPVTLDIGPLGTGGNACEMGVYPAKQFSAVKEDILFYLIPGLTYQFEGGSRVGGSAFIFQLGEDGVVRYYDGVHPPAMDGPSMHGGPHLLQLRVGWLDIVPESESVSYSVGQSRLFKGASRVPVILGLRTDLRVDTVGKCLLVGTAPVARQMTVNHKCFTITGPWEH